MATITADLTSGTRVEVRSDTHTWVVDEPADLGGTDEGPNPYELLLGALAGCTCITLSMYAGRKGMDLHSVSTRYTYDRIHADDCETCDDDASGWLDRVTAEIFVEGDFTEAERERLEQVATNCPVHRTLANGVTFAETVTVG